MQHSEFLTLNGLLSAAGLDSHLNTTLVMRHRPTASELRRVLPWWAADDQAAYNAYQQTQNENAENALRRATRLVSMIGSESKKALFVGIYVVNGFKPLTYEQYLAHPATLRMRSHGLAGFNAGRKTVLQFHLSLSDVLSTLKGKLVVSWNSERAWFRWANSNSFPIIAIAEDSKLITQMPSWDRLVLSWDELQAMPSKWRDAISQWRGVYYIFDTQSKKGYVGSAYGHDNILGRWLNYRKTGDGGNQLLKKQDPKGFKFSILQRLSPDLTAEEVIQIESTWKKRLHSLEFGLNKN